MTTFASPILYANLGNLVWIRIDGKGSFEISPQLRTFAKRELCQGEKRFVLDLEKCPVMDSTFMGTLLAISREVAKCEDGVFDVVNANQRNVSLMGSLGLDLIVSVDEENQRWQNERKEVALRLTEASQEESDLAKSTKATVMLEAHQALASAKPENEGRFHDVIEYLKRDLESNGNSC